MTVIDTYSKRMKRERGEEDVYRYENIGEGKFRRQFLYILSDCMDGKNCCAKFYSYLIRFIEREHGEKFSCGRFERSLNSSLFEKYYTKDTIDDLQILDCTQIALQKMCEFAKRDSRININEAISDVNTRFKENGLGYRFDAESDMVHRIDSEYVHANATKPALIALNDSKFKSVKDEFINAHKAYMAGDYEDAIVNCGKSLESALKIICTEKGWGFSKNDTANKLIQTVQDNGLIEGYIGASLQTVASIRNKNGGHGAGTNTKPVPEYIVTYQLNLTATNLKMLYDAYKQM